MKHTKTRQLLENFIAIRQAAECTDNGHRCMIAPHPDLKKKLDAEMKKLRSQAGKGLLGEKISVSNAYKPIGLNDGLIYPGTMFPVGTSAEMARSAAANRAPLSGTVRVIVVLVDFSDRAMVKAKAHFEDLFFSLGKIATGSVREYFREVSHSKIDIQGQVVGPYRLPKTMNQYAHGASGMGPTLPNARTMARDAAIKANPAVNFATYDNDLDNFVDAFVVVHAGPGGEQTGNVNDIWSHKWVLDGGAYTADGSTKIYGYLTVPEDCRLGVCAHELGHLLFGMPDLYDTDNSSEGIGNWCLMAGGTWNNGGNTPAHPSAWCKYKQNWVTTVNHTTNKSNVAIEDVKSGFQIHRLWKDGAVGNEYFLVENRQKILFDKYIPGSGILVWHIDEATPDNSNESHYKVALMQADGLRNMELNQNRGDGADSFPGTGNKRKFDSTTTPSSKSYAGSNTCVSLKNISDSASVMHADLSVKCTVTKVKEAKELIKEKEIFKERKEFEKSVVADKSGSHDKTFIEKQKDAEKPKDFEGKLSDIGGRLGQLGRAEDAGLEDRLARIEAMLGYIQPFIEQSLRPDLSGAAYQQDDSQNEPEEHTEE